MILIKIFVLRPAGVLRSGHLLLHPAAEDQYVEGGARLGESADLCVRAVVSLGDGGAADSSGGAEKTQP